MSWIKESERHALASRGIKTVHNDEYRNLCRYGGMKSWGGLSPYNQYINAIGYTFENLHCILGSLGELYGMDKDEIKHYISSGLSHIEEEIEIIERNFNEYTKDIYLLAPDGNGYGVFKRRDEVEKELKEKIPLIKERAYNGLIKIEELDILYEIKDVAKSCYYMYITMCDEIMSNLNEGLTPDNNIFKNREVIERFEDIKLSVNSLKEEYL